MVIHIDMKASVMVASSMGARAIGDAIPNSLIG
jgi:hypothetical protein